MIDQAALAKLKRSVKPGMDVATYIRDAATGVYGEAAEELRPSGRGGCKKYDQQFIFAVESKHLVLIFCTGLASTKLM